MKKSIDYLSKIIKKQKQLSFLIYPTPYSDFDVIAVGNKKKLREVKRRFKDSDYIGDSVWGFPLVLIETFDDVNEAVRFIDKIAEN